MSKYGCYKIATGNFVTKVGDIKANLLEIEKLIIKADKNNVDVLCFPELSLTGYTLQDFFYLSSVIEETYNSIEYLTKIIPEKMLVLVGGPFAYLNKLYDVCYILAKDEIKGIQVKTYLPNYNEFYEKRWFSSYLDSFIKTVNFLNREIPFGNDLIIDAGEIKIGCEICEDLWVINPISNKLCLNGANVIFNLSSSNDIIGKKEYREELVRFQSSKNYCAYIYSSSGFGESSQDLVFSGAQFIYENGKCIAKSSDVKDLLIGVIDVSSLNYQRLKYKSSFENSTDSVRYIPFKFKDNDLLENNIISHPFVLEDEKKRRERSLEIIALQAKGLASKMHNTNIYNLVLGVSGGLDSTLAYLVCIEAYKYLNIDMKDKFYCISMPGFATSNTTYNNARELIELSNAIFLEIDITKQARQHLLDIDHKEDVFDVTYENVQARIRTLILMDYANKVNGLVVGTSDLSELALGFTTYNGDHMSMYGVNCSIPKTLVKSLVLDYSYFHKEFKKVIESIVSTPISPELVPSKDGKIVQKTENILGKYDLHDFFLYHFLRDGFSKDKIFKMAQIAFKDLPKEYIMTTLDTFFKRFMTNQFKRSCLPDGIKVGSINLSPRGDLRLSSDLSIFNSINKKLD